MEIPLETCVVSKTLFSAFSQFALKIRLIFWLMLIEKISKTPCIFNEVLTLRRSSHTWGSQKHIQRSIFLDLQVIFFNYYYYFDYFYFLFWKFIFVVLKIWFLDSRMDSDSHRNILIWTYKNVLKTKCMGFYTHIHCDFKNVQYCILFFVYSLLARDTFNWIISVSNVKQLILLTFCSRYDTEHNFTF